VMDLNVGGFYAEPAAFRLDVLSSAPEAIA